MQVKINKRTHEVPFDLSIITLGKFIDYQEKYGNDLDKQLTVLIETKYEGDFDDIELQRTMDLETHLDSEAIAWYSFWTGYNLNEVRNHPSIIILLSQYRLFRMMMKNEIEETKAFPLTFIWNNEQWKIADFKLRASDEMTFNEIVTSKEVLRQMHKLEKGKWDALPYLCAIFLRKSGEAYSDDLIAEDGERLQLFQSLPLNHALQVAFFLNICVHFWNRLSAFSEKQEEAAILN